MWLFKRTDSRSDEELIRTFRSNGDKAVFSALFKNHVTAIYGTCLFYFKDKEEAKDATMAIFEKLLTELRKTQVENFKGWLSFVVRNHCISELRKKQTAFKNAKGYYEFEYSESVYEEEIRIEKVSDDIMLKHMTECLPLLKEKQRKCVELFYLSSKSYTEISSITAYSVNEVKSYIQNGKRKLKLLIEEKVRKSSPE